MCCILFGFEFQSLSGERRKDDEETTIDVATNCVMIIILIVTDTMLSSSFVGDACFVGCWLQNGNCQQREAKRIFFLPRQSRRE